MPCTPASRKVWPTTTTLAPREARRGGGRWRGRARPARYTGGLARYALTGSPVARAEVSTTAVNNLAADADLGTVLGVANRRLFAWRGEASGPLAGSWYVGQDDLAGLSSSQGDAILLAFSELDAVDTRPVWLLDTLSTPAPSSTGTVTVRWRDPLVPACTTDCPDLASGIDFTCTVTGGACTVTSVDPASRDATVQWTLPATPGDQELSVAVGDPRWFATAIDRVSVESP